MMVMMMLGWRENFDLGMLVLVDEVDHEGCNNCWEGLEFEMNYALSLAWRQEFFDLRMLVRVDNNEGCSCCWRSDSVLKIRYTPLSGGRYGLRLVDTCRPWLIWAKGNSTGASRIGWGVCRFPELRGDRQSRRKEQMKPWVCCKSRVCHTGRYIHGRRGEKEEGEGRGVLRFRSVSLDVSSIAPG